MYIFLYFCLFFCFHRLNWNDIVKQSLLFTTVLHALSKSYDFC